VRGSNAFASAQHVHTGATNVICSFISPYPFIHMITFSNYLKQTT
jgi:hypothetical protein